MTPTSERNGPAAWRQTRIGLALAGVLIAAWLTTHVIAVWFHRWTPAGWVAAPLLVALQCWLSVGLFIVAHDAMHGSLSPAAPRLNRIVGQVALFLYAGFLWRDVLPRHHAHHRHAGTAADPDFHPDAPDRFWPWYARFMMEYASAGQLARMAVLVSVAALLGAPPANIAVFWIAPALLSSVQLFLFGTYLPHRDEGAPFPDRHRARSSGFPPWLSLLTCFHFGHHHEHHLKPGVPWWRLHRQRAHPS